MNPEVRNQSPRRLVVKDPQPYIDMLRRILLAEEQSGQAALDPLGEALMEAEELLGEFALHNRIVPLNYALAERRNGPQVSRTSEAPGVEEIADHRNGNYVRIVAPRDWIERWLAAGPGSVEEAIRAWQKVGMPIE